MGGHGQLRRVGLWRRDGRLVWRRGRSRDARHVASRRRCAGPLGRCRRRARRCRRYSYSDAQLDRQPDRIAERIAFAELLGDAVAEPGSDGVAVCLDVGVAVADVEPDGIAVFDAKPVPEFHRLVDADANAVALADCKHDADVEREADADADGDTVSVADAEPKRHWYADPVALAQSDSERLKNSLPDLYTKRLGDA